MSSIDKRIVQMQFDNAGFEKGVNTTMSSLQKLNEKLKMKNANDGLDNIGKGISKLSATGFSGLSSGVEAVTARFSALNTIAMTTLANITNRAVNAGISLVKSLTIDPITTGFSEYETKMGSIQTILTNTAHEGTTLKQVTSALDELNTYADQTIYNFAEMTKNIGTFTAAGVDLDTSVASIKGIANLAAASGSTSQQASTAMYQLSQALAAGKVSLMDWNSVVNAGMGGKLFQDALIRTSETLGTGAENAIKKFGSFRESLTRGEWLTTDVLTETLKQISGAYTEAELIAQGYTETQAKSIIELAKNATAAATEVKTITQLFDTMKESVQSGWAQSWEWIVGDKDQATKTLTSISEAFNNLMEPSTKARNEMLKFWNEAGGRDDVIAGFTNVFQSLGKGLSAIGSAWKEVFPSMTGEKLVELSSKFKDFTEKLKMSDETAGKIKETFKGVFSVFRTVGQVVGGVVKAFVPLLGALKPIGSMLLNITSAIGKFVSGLVDVANKTNAFGKIGDTIGNTFKAIGNYIGKAADVISKFIKSMDFSGVGSSLMGVLSSIGNGIGNALSSINFDTLINLGKTIVGLGVFETLRNILDQFGVFSKSIGGVFDTLAEAGSNVVDILGETKDALAAWQSSLNAKTLLTLASAIAILAASLIALSTIDAGKLATSLGAMAVLFAELSLAMLAINKIGNIKGLVKTGSGMVLIASAILILSGALKTLSSINLTQIATGLTAMAGLLVTMAASVKLFSKSSSGLIKTSTGLIIFGAAMHVMASALKTIGSIDAEVLGGGLFAMAGILAELAAFMSAAKFGKLGVGTATGIVLLSTALVILSQAVKQFGNLNPDQIIRGLAGIAGILAEITVFSKISGSGLGMIATAAGLTALSGAMLVMSAAMNSLGATQWDELARGLTAMAGGLTILGMASKLISGGSLALLGVGVGIMSIALLGLNKALVSMGNMSWEQIGKGLLVLASSLTVLAVAMTAMSGALLGAAAMIVIAGALAILTPQLIALGNMSLGEIGKSLLALAGAFTVIGVAGALLGIVSPLLIAFGAALGVIGIACVACGAGLGMVGTALGVITATIGASGAIIVNFLKELVNLLPQLGQKAAEGFTNFINTLAAAAPQLIDSFSSIISSIIDALDTLVPKLADLAVKMVVALANGLAEAAPKLVEAGLKLVLGILQGIENNIEQIVTSGINCVTKFMDGISAALPDLAASAANLALTFIESVANAISSNKARLESAVRSVITAVIDAGIAVIKGAYSAFKSKGGELLNSFVNGIKSKYAAAKSACTEALNRAKSAFKNVGSALRSAGSSLIEGFTAGIKAKAQSVWNAAKSVVEGAIRAAKSALKINSPSKVFMEIGKYTSQGFAVGLDKYAGEASTSATNLANAVIDNVKNPLRMVSKILDGDINANPVITPVVDLTNVKAGANQLNGLFANSDVQLNGRANLLANSIGTIQNGSGNAEIITALKDLKNSIANNSGNSYTINGITYDDGSNIVDAVKTLVRAAKIERRI